MTVSIADIRHAIEIVLIEIYPDISALGEGCYSLNDILDQLIFELIKEEYKKYAARRPIQYYLDLYDSEHYGTSRKYTRALQYAQFYKDFDNECIEEAFGLRLPELEAQDVTGSNVFSGHRFTECEFLQFKMQAECRLLNKLHGKQLDNSKNVAENDFRKFFEEYSNFITGLEPQLSSTPEHVISCVLAYYGLETHFLTEFLYRLTLCAEKSGFPKEIHTERILSVCGLTTLIPKTKWCPTVLLADLCILPKWYIWGQDIFNANDKDWKEQERLLLDCKQMKNIILQKAGKELVELAHSCTWKDKENFIAEKYWLWDNSPDYEWTSERIRYYRKLHAAVTREFPKPHIK